MSRAVWIRKVDLIAKEFGATVTSTNGGHLMLILPNGARVYTASTASDHRGIKNLRSDLRRYAAQPPRKKP